MPGIGRSQGLHGAWGLGLAAALALGGCAVAPPTTMPATPEAPAQAPMTNTPTPPLPASPPAAPPPPRPSATVGTSNSDLGATLMDLSARPQTPGHPFIRLLSLGHSQSGQALLALRFAQTDEAEPGKRPSVLLIGQQRGNEPVSAEALLRLIRELAVGQHAELLKRVDLIVLPRLDADGAERAPGSTGAPAIDIERDHLLLQTPEARALAQLVRDEDPAVVVELREFDASPAAWQRLGALPAAPLQFHYATTPNVPPLLTRAAEEWFRQPLFDALERQGTRAEWYYTLSGDAAGKALVMGSVQPDTERNVNGLKNAVSLLIATRAAGAEPEALRAGVELQLHAVASLLASAAMHADDLNSLRRYLRRDVAAQACHGQAVIEARPVRAEHQLVMLDLQSGAPETLTVDWDSTLQLEPVRQRPRPCGYWLAADALDAVDRLRALGVRVDTLRSPASVLASQYQSPTTLVDSLVDLPAGSYLVSLAQPLANLAIAALEPDGPQGFFAHGLIGRLDQIARLRAPLDPEAPVVAPTPENPAPR